MFGRAVPFDVLAGYAYGVDRRKVVIDGPVPDGKYDVLLTIGEDPQTQLQAEIKKLYGLVGHLDTRTRDVLELTVASADAPGLKPHPEATVSDGGSGGGGMVGMGKMNLQNTSIPQFISNLQQYFDKPITDHSGLTDRYDISIQWSRSADPQSRAPSVESALKDQLGLELTPATESRQVLVMEKAP